MHFSIETIIRHLAIVSVMLAMFGKANCQYESDRDLRVRNKVKMITEWDSVTNTNSQRLISTTTYNTSGEIVKFFDSFRNSVQENIYDEKQNVTRAIWEATTPDTLIRFDVVVEYDERNQPVRETTLGRDTIFYSNTYNDDGLLTRQVRQSKLINCTRNLIYTKFNQLKKETSGCDGPDDNAMVYLYSYNRHHQLKTVRFQLRHTNSWERVSKYNKAGQLSVEIVRYYFPNTKAIIKYYYLDNGLLSYAETYQENSLTSVTKYQYEYYD